VARRDVVRVAGADLGGRPVLVLDVHPARDRVAEVLGLAAVRPNDRLDALRPAPARLEDEAADLGRPVADDVDLGLLRAPDLLRSVQVLGLDSSRDPLVRLADGAEPSAPQPATARTAK
jgi:hypothetical protein